MLLFLAVKTGLLLLSLTAAKLAIQLREVITLSACAVNGKRGREIDLPRAVHSILNEISKIGRYEANNSRKLISL